MTERDSGRYDAFTDTWIGQEVKVDFAWGSIPMQPNDDRDINLDPALDSHIIATSQYEGFPAFTPGAPFDDTIPNVEVPNLVGLTFAEAQDALAAAGLDYSSSNTTSGANSGNNGKVKSQSPAAGTLVNVSSPAGDTVIAFEVYYQPMALVPNLSGLNWSAANSAINNAGFIVGTTATDVDTDNLLIANTVASQSPAAGTYAVQGSAIGYHLYNYVPSAIIPNTTNWMFRTSDGMMFTQDRIFFGTNYDQSSEIPTDLASNPTNYSVVISGSNGSAGNGEVTNGTYPILGVDVPIPGMGGSLTLKFAGQSINSQLGQACQGSTYDGSPTSGNISAASVSVVHN